MVEINDTSKLIVGDLQGILGQQLSRHPILLLIIFTFLN